MIHRLHDRATGGSVKPDLHPATPIPARRWERLASLAIGCIVVACIAVPNYPGRINADTISMLTEARSGAIRDWHAPLIQMAWSVVDRIFPFGGLFLLQSIVLVASSAILIQLAGCRPLTAAVGASAVWLNPIAYALASSFTRDIWVLAAFLPALLGVLVVTTGRPLIRRMNLLRWGTAVWILILMCSRQNAAALAAGVALVVYRPKSAERRHLKRLTVIALSLLPAVVLPPIARSLGAQASGPETPVMIADLDEMSSRTGKVELPNAVLDGVTLDDLNAGSTIFEPDQLWYSLSAPRVRVVGLDAKTRAEVRSRWLSVVRTHPFAWLSIRAKLFARQIGISGPTRGTYLPLDIQNDLGITSARWPGHEAAIRWSATTALPGSIYGRWWTRPWIWLTAGVVVLLMARHRAQRTVVRSLVFAALAYCATYFPAATDLQNRFVAPAVVLAQLATVTATLERLDASVRSRLDPAGTRRTR